jgi:1,3-beta-glucanosyltransferase GAS1
MCNSTEQLSFAMDQYYKSQNSQAGACNYQGAGNIKQGVTPSGTCASLMSQAGSAGTGTVTSQPGSTGGSSSSGPKKAAASTSGPDYTLSVVIMGFYVTIMGIFGAGIILL